MALVQKIVLLPLVLVAACVIAGSYGVLHNQISYTVALDYFHGFKFEQFRIAPSQQNRIGASIVGWLAAWWMGAIIGTPLAMVALIGTAPKQYFQRSLESLLVAATTALLIGLVALVYAFTQSNLTAFERAGSMHNFSYLGGGVGILTGAAYLIANSTIDRARRETPDDATQT